MKPTAATATDGTTCALDPKTLHILVIEDNDDCRTSLRDLLRLHGHQVDEAADGLEGVEKALALRPGVALVDINMPGLNGYEVAKALRAGPDTRDALIVAMTGYGQDADRERSREVGIDHHLVKPVDPNEVGRLLAAGRGPAG